MVGGLRDFFPMPEVEAATLVRDAAMKAGLPVPVAPPVTPPDVLVTATPRRNLFRVYRGTNSIGPIPKDCDLAFEVADIDKLPPDTAVEWVVRNGPGRAEDANDLGHRAGTGLRATERSAYRGIHFMDCIFQRGGKTVGVRRVRV